MAEKPNKIDVADSATNRMNWFFTWLAAICLVLLAGQGVFLAFFLIAKYGWAQ